MKLNHGDHVCILTNGSKIECFVVENTDEWINVKLTRGDEASFRVDKISGFIRLAAR